jgi:hypothetical protein
VPSIASVGYPDMEGTVLSEGGKRFCENCGTEIGQTTNFCRNCEAAQHPGPEASPGPPPPPASTTPAQGGMGGCLRQNILIIGVIIGVIALDGFILVNFDYEAAKKAYNESRSGKSLPSPSSNIGGTGEKREVTGQASLDNLMPEQVSDFKLQTSEPLKKHRKPVQRVGS